MEIDRERLARAAYVATLQGGSAHNEQHISAVFEGGRFDYKHYGDDARKHVEAILTDISAQGFVIAPREPSEAMIEAGSEARPYREDDGRDEFVDRNTEMTYTAMIHAIEASR